MVGQASDQAIRTSRAGVAAGHRRTHQLQGIRRPNIDWPAEPSHSGVTTTTAAAPTLPASPRPASTSLTVVTHWHYDHAFGLAAFDDVPRIAHESVQDRLSSAEAAADAKRLGLDPQELGQPNVEIAVATALDLGDRRVEIAHLGRGHTEGDLVVVVPDADLLFAGDLLESAGPPSFGADSVPDEWPATLDAVIGLMTATTVAVPGHGEPVEREFVFEQRGRIAAQAAETPEPPRPTLPLA